MASGGSLRVATAKAEFGDLLDLAAAELKRTLVSRLTAARGGCCPPEACRQGACRQCGCKAGDTLPHLQSHRASKGDRHAIVVDPAGGLLYELFGAKRTDGGWQAASAA